MPKGLEFHLVIKSWLFTLTSIIDFDLLLAEEILFTFLLQSNKRKTPMNHNIKLHYLRFHRSFRIAIWSHCDNISAALVIPICNDQFDTSVSSVVLCSSGGWVFILVLVLVHFVVILCLSFFFFNLIYDKSINSKTLRLYCYG